MGSWDFDAVLARHGVKLTQSEKEAIWNKLPKSDAPGIFDADAVFEGGGVLGIALLGAARCCADLGIRWRGLAGTSAGAITAALLSADLPIRRIEEAVGGLDFLGLLRETTSPLIRDSDPSDDLSRPVSTLTRLFLSRQLGEYSSDPFHDWLEALLREAGATTFDEIESKLAERKLRVVVSDITNGQMLVLPDDLEHGRVPGAPREIRVAEAVRLSMSIPLFFTPGRLGDAVIVDGGVLSNFPVWLFDEATEPVENPAKVPAWPTFGFRLVDRNAERPHPIHHAGDLLVAMLKTMMCAHDKHHLSQSKRTRTVNIDITSVGISATRFNLTESEKEELYLLGYTHTKQFLLDEWSWDKHLSTRGFAAKSSRQPRRRARSAPATP